MFRHTLVLVLAITLVPSLVWSAEENPPKEGTYYKHGQLGIRKVQANGNRIDVEFRPNTERFHWCPGVTIKKTDVATVVTFVRCKTSKTCGVDKKATVEKKLIRKVSIDTGGLHVYVRNGPNKFKLLYKSPNAKSKPGSKKKKDKSSAAS